MTHEQKYSFLLAIKKLCRAYKSYLLLIQVLLKSDRLVSLLYFYSWEWSMSSLYSRSIDLNTSSILIRICWNFFFLAVLVNFIYSMYSSISFETLSAAMRLFNILGGSMELGQFLIEWFEISFENWVDGLFCHHWNDRVNKVEQLSFVELIGIAEKLPSLIPINYHLKNNKWQTIKKSKCSKKTKKRNNLMSWLTSWKRSSLNSKKIWRHESIRSTIKLMTSKKPWTIWLKNSGLQILD